MTFASILRKLTGTDARPPQPRDDKIVDAVSVHIRTKFDAALQQHDRAVDALNSAGVAVRQAADAMLAEIEGKGRGHA